MFLLYLLCGFLLFSSHVLAFSFSISTVQQCEPVTISFSGGSNATVLPSTLTIIPFNSVPLSLPIPDTGVLSSGVYVTFLPLSANTTFVASLDNAQQQSIADVSDIIRVLPSPSGNTTCMSLTNQPHKQFTVQGQLSQCEDFTITYNSSAVPRAPVVRLFDPKGSSFFLNNTFENLNVGLARYQMNFGRGKQVVLMISDDQGNQETTNLFTVGGDSSSNSDCLNKNASNSSMVKNTSGLGNGASAGVPKSIIIGCAVGGSIIILISLCMVAYVFIDRKRRRLRHIEEFDPTFMVVNADQVAASQATTKEKPRFLDGMAVSNPPYTSEGLLSPMRPVHLRSSLASWAQATPEDQKYPSSRQQSIDAPQRYSEDRLSLNSEDLEGILNMARVHSENGSSISEPFPFSPNISAFPLPPPLPEVVIPRQFTRNHFRDPSDVPADPTSSRTFSGYSVNPFNEGQTRTASQLTPPTFILSSPTSSLISPSMEIIGLPSSPRNGLRQPWETISNSGGSRASPAISDNGERFIFRPGMPQR